MHWALKRDWKRERGTSKRNLASCRSDPYQPARTEEAILGLMEITGCFNCYAATKFAIQGTGILELLHGCPPSYVTQVSSKPCLPLTKGYTTFFFLSKQPYLEK